MSDKIKKVTIKCADIDKIYDEFTAMDFKAEYYVPTVEELKSMVLNLKEWAIFLLWINDTGEITEENSEEHAIIEQIIKEYIIIDYDTE